MKNLIDKRRNDDSRTRREGIHAKPPQASSMDQVFDFDHPSFSNHPDTFTFFFSLKTIQDGFELEDASLAFYDFLIMASFFAGDWDPNIQFNSKKRFLMVKGCELRWLNLT